MKSRHYQLRLVIFSWDIFRLFPLVRPLGEQDNYFSGFALDWLGYELCFEGLVADEFGLKTKAELKAKGEE